LGNATLFYKKMKKKEKKCHILYKYGPANVLSLNVLLNFDPAHLLDCGDAERTIFAGVGWQPGGILS
jgi:hypothetical protein